MDASDFAAVLRSEGFAAPIARSLPPGMAAPEHTHEFHAKVLVTAGDFTLTRNGIAMRYRPGDMFTVPLGSPHAELAGPAGAEYLAGRRYPTG